MTAVDLLHLAYIAGSLLVAAYLVGAIVVRIRARWRRYTSVFDGVASAVIWLFAIASGISAVVLLFRGEVGVGLAYCIVPVGVAVNACAISRHG